MSAFLALAGLALLAGLVLLLPALRRPRAVDPVAAEIAAQRARLAELARETEAGLVAAPEAAAARAEVERRLLRLARRREADGDVALRPTRAGRLVVAAAAVLAPLGAAALYGLALGRPGLPDAPFAARAPEGGDGIGLADIRGMVERLEARLATAPADAEGWVMLARSRLALGEAPAAVAALREAAARGADGPPLWGELAYALTAAAGGTVTPEARALFARVPAADAAADPRAAFYLGLADAQAGDPAAAARRWQALLAGAPADAAWRPRVEAALREVAPGLGVDAAALIAAAPGTPPAAGPTAAAPSPTGPAAAPGGPATAGIPAGGEAVAALPADERARAIRGMVERLEARLRSEGGGGDAEGWRRLGQAREVLGEPEAAREAYARAYALAPADPAAVAGYAQSLLGPADPRTRLPAVGDESRRLFGEAAALSPDDPGPHFYLGVRALQDGRPDEARARWERALALLPKDHPDRPAIEEALGALGGGTAGG